MSELITTPLNPTPPEAEFGPAEKPRSFASTVTRNVLRAHGAQAGLIWVGLLIFCAVFSPFIASSHPIAMKVNGVWSSPLLRHLAPTDVILLIAFFLAIVIFPIKALRLKSKLLAFAILLAVATAASIQWVQPPEVIVYDTYREMARDGKIEKAFYAPIPFSPSDYLRDQPELRLTGPTSSHIMGITVNGADLASNMIHATRIALSIGFISTGIAVLIGIAIGALMGYFAGWVDLLGMRLVEIFDAIPTLLLLLSFVAFFGANLYIMMAIIGATSWVGYATFIRAEFLTLRQRDYVQAAIAAGLPLRSILFRHMLPNGITPVLVSASFGVAGAILAESTLSFLGIGLVGEASWGSLLNQALGVGGTFFWWIALYPGLAIFLTVFAYNLIGEALRDALDPKLRVTK